MKAKIAFIALALFAGQAQAEWKLFGETDDAEFYIDLSTKRVQGNKTFVWAMSDYFKPQVTSDGKKYQSSKSLWVFKCADLQSGLKSLVLYSKKLGAGNIVNSESRELFDVKFDDVIPDSVADSMTQKACGGS